MQAYSQTGQPKSDRLLEPIATQSDGASDAQGGLSATHAPDAGSPNETTSQQTHSGLTIRKWPRDSTETWLLFEERMPDIGQY